MPDIFVAETKNQKPVNPVSNPTSEPKSAFENDFQKTTEGGVHLFTSYCENPEDITFENQDPDEKVLLFLRKDLITNFPWILTGILFSLLPIVIIPILNFLQVPISFLPQSYIFLFTILYYLLVTSFLFVKFTTWYFNIDIVTHKRIVDIDFEGIVYKNVAATKINLVQDVSYSQVGVFRTIFDYGDVLVQTAGTIDNFIFEAAPRPEDAVHVIEDLIGKKRE